MLIKTLNFRMNSNLANKKNIKKKKMKIKKLIKGYKRANGRNNTGKITVKHRGGGHKRLYRKVTFKRDLSHEGFVKKIIYDPNRSANIAYIENNIKSFFIISPENLKINQYIKTGKNIDFNIGNSLPISDIPVGSKIHNISLRPNSEGSLARSAGTYAELIQNYNNKYAKIKLNSGQIKLILSSCYATLGIVSNINHNKINFKKAGRSRWLNKRPHVRGVAKNPVDHPHGGGEGKTSGGRPSVSPKGFITKGKKTTKKKLIIT